MSLDENIQSLQSLIEGRYKVIKALGKGTQGTVYLAQELASGESVAIKELMIQSVKDWKQYDLFRREADTLKRIHIAGVAKLHDAMEILNIAEPRALIIQDYIKGDPLQAFIANGHRFSINQIGDLLLQLLNIIEKLHESNPQIIHRDIKPSNVMLSYVAGSEYPVVHLIDFGAVSNPQVKGGGSTVVGTYGYMAPEQLMGHAEAASDIYALAIVAVYLLSGVAPENLEIQDFQVLIDPHLEHLPHQITAVLRQMLAPKVAKRLTSYSVIRSFFEALKNQAFHQIPDVDESLVARKYFDLKKVEAFMQPGNIDIWQDLSDTVPRQIPRYLAKYIKAKNFQTIITKPYSHRGSGTTSLVKELNKSRFIIGVVVLLSFIVALEAVFNIDKLFPTLLILICFVGSFAFKLFDHLSTAKANVKVVSDEFWVNARKSMATVVRIEYQPVYPKMIAEKQPLSERSEIPTWRITYSFNPPDDDSPDALVRTFETHSSVDDLKEGSLIPILYNIKEYEHYKHVESTPYPLPYVDILELQ